MWTRTVRQGERCTIVEWLGMEGSNLRFLIQSQASYHWTNPQRGGCGAAILRRKDGDYKNVTSDAMVLTG